MSQKKKSPAKKRAETIGKRIEKNKKEVLKMLEKTPIFEAAAHQAGVSSSTFYRWLDDVEFKEEVDKSHRIGVAYMNDVAESKVISGIHKSDKTMVIFWLKNRHEMFSDKRYHEHYFRKEDIKDGPLTEARIKQIAEVAEAWRGRRNQDKAK